jgi:restriction system protein
MGVNYYRVVLGKGGEYAQECFNDGFIGVDFYIHQDLSPLSFEEQAEFRQKFLPIFHGVNPKGSKVTAGLVAGVFWKILSRIQVGDQVVCPDGKGNYHVGEVISDYAYCPGQNLPHRRKVRWRAPAIPKTAMSDGLRGTLGTLLTIIGPDSVTVYADEIERLIGGGPAIGGQPCDPTVEDPIAFAMEKHLEEFLVKNWSQTSLGKEFDIFSVDGVVEGQQFETDTGPIDILAISKDKKRLLVIELKRGRASDVVVGQILRYIGYVRQSVAEENQTVEGIIIALDDDHRIRLALSAVPSISFYRYEISFKLTKA